MSSGHDARGIGALEVNPNASGVSLTSKRGLSLCHGRRGGWHEAMVLVGLPLAAPIGLSPLHVLTLCGSERATCLGRVARGGGGGGEYVCGWHFPFSTLGAVGAANVIFFGGGGAVLALFLKWHLEFPIPRLVE